MIVFNYLFITIIIIGIIPSHSYPQNKLLGEKLEIYLIDQDILKENKEKIKSKDKSIYPAFKKLQLLAGEALTKGPFSVMYKSRIPPSGDKHDYMSIGPYWWPDPGKPGGLPYVRKDGVVNPEVYDYKDKQQLVEMCLVVQLTALAYYLTEEERFAEYASNILKIWFVDEKTRMNPNLNFGQSIPGISDGRSVGIIETRHFTEILDAVGLIKTSQHWENETEEKIRQWFEQYFTWLINSELGKQEANAKNNHGTWYIVQASAIALFIGKPDFAEKIIREAGLKIIENNIEPDGRQPEELSRTRSLSYSTFNLEALFSIAILGKHVGVDLWNFKTEDGASLQKAFDFLLPFYLKEKEWPFEQIRGFEYERTYSLLLQAVNYFNDEKYKEIEASISNRFRDDISIILYK